MRLLAGSVFLVALMTLSGTAVLAGPGVDFDAQAKRCFGCHEEVTIKSANYLHAPVAANACSMCHTPHSGPDTATKLTTKGDDLCFECHEAADYRGKNEHNRTESGCLGCHAPHGGKNSTSLRASATQLCAGCHSKTTKHKRGKRASGDCTSCHDLHAARRGKLLRSRSLAGTCKRDRGVKRPTRIAKRR